LNEIRSADKQSQHNEQLDEDEVQSVLETQVVRIRAQTITSPIFRRQSSLNEAAAESALRQFFYRVPVALAHLLSALLALILDVLEFGVELGDQLVLLVHLQRVNG